MTLMSVDEHRRAAPDHVRCAVLTISDSRTEATDTSGRAIAELLEEAGHAVAARSLVPDDPERIRAAVRELLARPDVQVVLTTGGTGISRRDSTYEVVSGLLEKRLDGFGELFRMLSYTEIGAAAMLTRACAGVAAGRFLVALPGSEAAVRLAMRRLVLPELGHVVRETTR
jgi:molybdenum cofactor biosynthesis protein B